MIPKSIEDLKVGMQFRFRDATSIFVRITGISGGRVTYEYEDKNSATRDVSSFLALFSYVEKPLDKFNREYLSEIPKPKCKHTNIREDRFFSAMVYRTCKDCGEPLN